MKKESILLIYLLFVFKFFLNAQPNTFEPTKHEIETMKNAIKADSNLSTLMSWFGEPETLYKNYKRNLYLADSIWHFEQNNLSVLDIGVTEKFELIPLVDWFTASDNLIGESGVSYLIRTDDAAILFDVGLNANETHPSPLLHNMTELGISLDEIDAIVISHNHGDHVGGEKWSAQNTFSLSNQQLELNDINIFTPCEMKYPGLHPSFSPKPTKISKGVATIGVIHKPAFALNIAEQALAVNIKDKGIVVISGCGHQSMKNIVERCHVLFDEPLYGILGGFHYPLEEGRNINWIYKYVVVEKLPWERLTVEDLNGNINLLKSNGIKVVGISGHDSCDKSIELFKNVFKDNYIDIVVGQKIVLSE